MLRSIKVFLLGKEKLADLQTSKNAQAEGLDGRYL